CRSGFLRIGVTRHHALGQRRGLHPHRPRTLARLRGGSFASALNDFGQVVGNSDNHGPPMQATIWNGGTPTALVGGSGGVANDINNAGQVVGASSSPAATIWNGGIPTALAETVSNAIGINNLGQVAGYISDPSGRPQATVWTGGVPTFLAGGTVGGSVANNINDHGQVVGVGDSGAMVLNGTTPSRRIQFHHV